ncbi:MAG: TIGR03364 family FAD-dependent oxidoreductase [Phycisphaeraceae bacterium]|nr:MAG: TIGR03364 family FAD-dependent oxidoreductase [Phycisphaeraceae bacterium]
MDRVDVAVVGAGIVGIAHAVEAHRRGLSVAVVERGPRAAGASIRNFGMFWPIGQPAGRAFARAMISREVYLDLASKAGFWADPLGSLHAVYHDDEWACVHEFVERARPRGFRVEALGPEDARARCPGLNPQGLRGGLWSDTEIAVDPRQVVARVASWLGTRPGVTVRFSSAATRIEAGAGRPRLHLADGSAIDAERIFVCGGDDIETLYPEAFRGAPLTRCKLQMLRTGSQPGGWRLGVHLATGSTLRHYPVFKGLPSLDALSRRFSREHPEFDRWGIHVMASQMQGGELTIGDSHEYGPSPEPFNREAIDDLILGYLRGVLHAPDPRIAERWYGVYLKRTDGHLEFIHEPAPGVRLITGLGGNGMTLSFGLAREHFESLGRGEAWVHTPV